MADIDIELHWPLGSIITPVTEFSNAQLTTSVDEGDTFSFSIDGNNPASRHIRDLITDVILYRDGQKLFRGRIVSSLDTMDAASHSVAVSAVDYKSLLKRRQLTSALTVSGDLESVAWGAINFTQTYDANGTFNLGIVRPANQSIGVTGGFAYDQDETVKDFIDRVAKTNTAEGAGDYFEWTIDANLQFRVFRPSRGRQQPQFLCDYGGSVLSIGTSFDPNSYSNHFVVRGAGTISTIQGSTDLGRWPGAAFQTVYNDSAFSTVAQTDAKAFWLMTFSGQLNLMRSYNLELSADRWGGPRSLWIGDAVTLSIVSGRVNVNSDQYRVLNLHYEIAESGQEKIAIEVGYATSSTYRDFNRMSSYMLAQRRSILAARANWYNSLITKLTNEWRVQVGKAGANSNAARAAKKRLDDLTNQKNNYLSSGPTG